jgi:2-methylisocitrate lyase-like PEP mutase family enzyme
MTRSTELRSRFLDLHRADEILIMPNPFDIGSAKLLASVGAQALATTSAGHAATMGRLDQHVTREEVLAHAETMVAATDLPLNIDSEDCFADTADGVAETARLIAATDAAGFSIEDFDPRSGRIRDVSDAADRVAAAQAGGGDLVLTARAENHLYGVTDLDDTIERLVRYRDAGADVLYAPGLSSAADLARVVDAIEAPLNVLALPGTPPIPELADLGVSRVSVGSLAAWAAYGAVVEMATELFGPGTTTYARRALDSSLRDRAFG